jgi:hypothetical protein
MSNLCEQDHLLLDLAAGRLSAQRQTAAERHVAECPQCRGQLPLARRLAGDLSRLAEATRADLPEATARELLVEAESILRERDDAVVIRLKSIRLRARRRARLTVLRRMLVPAAAAAVILAVLHVAGMFSGAGPESFPAVKHLYADAGPVTTVAGIKQIEPVARRAMDEAMSALTPDVGRVANLQLVHYITRRAVEPGQADDIHFLLALLQQQDREGQAVAARRDIWDVLASLEPQACAASGIPWLEEARKLMRSGRYEGALAHLAERAATRGQPLAAYAAIRAGQCDEARQLLEALVMAERGDRRLVELLWAELAMAEDRFDVATRHFASAAESDSRLWLQAGYLAKYELGDEALAGQFFERTGDELVADHIARRFRSDVLLSRQTSQLFAQDFEAFPVGSIPPDWKLVPTHAGEYEIARIDESNVLKLNEMGYRDAKLYTGYPGWQNYTLACDFKVLQHGRRPQLRFVVYEHGVNHYAVSVAGDNAQLTHRQYNRLLRPRAARTALPEPVEAGAWWRCVVRTENLSRHRTQVTVNLWPRDRKAPDEPLIIWQESADGAGRTLQRGIVAFRVTDAEVAFDNVLVTSDDGVP